MKTINIHNIMNLVFWSSIGFLFVTGLVVLLVTVFKLEFSQSSFEDIFFGTAFVGTPSAIMLTLTKSFKGRLQIFLPIQIIVTFVAAIYSVVMLFGLLFSSICEWTDVEVLYTNVRNPDVQIVKREYGCGAMDGAKPTVLNHKVSYFTPFFKYAEYVDINQIDNAKWEKYHSKIK